MGDCCAAVYLDAPWPNMKLNSFTGDSSAHSMVFQGKLSGQSTRILIDTGASHCFIDTAFAQHCGFVITPDSGSVSCGGKATATVVGSVLADLRLQGYKEHITFHSTDLPLDFPVILGNDWMAAHSCILDYEQLAMTFKHKSKSFILRCPDGRRLKRGGGTPTLNFLQAKRLTKQGSKSFLLIICPVEEVESEADAKVHHIVEEFKLKDVFRAKAHHIVEEFKDVFRDLPPGLPPERDSAFRINTGDSDPVSRRAYRLTPKERDRKREIRLKLK